MAHAIFDASEAMRVFPDMKVAFLVAPATVPVDRENPDVAARIANRLCDVYGSSEALVDHPLSQAYRQFYAAMNVRPSSASTPIRQALRVFEKGYRPIHPVVDICMEIEYATLCSFQVYDRESLGSKIVYVEAKEADELPQRAHGEGRCKLRPGELLLTDERGIINSPTCGNAAARLVTAASRAVVVRIFKIPAVEDAVFDAAVAEAERRLAAERVVLLDKTCPIFEVIV